MKAPRISTAALGEGLVWPASGLVGLGGLGGTGRGFRALLEVESAGAGEREERATQGQGEQAEPARAHPDRSRRESPPEPVRVEPVAAPPAADPPPQPTATQPAPADPLPLQQLVQQMVREVSIQQVGSQTSLRLQLSTPGIRRLGLDLRIEGGRLTARFSVPDLQGREMLRSAAHQLEASLGARGIALGTIEVEVEQPPPTAGSDPGSGERHAGGGRQRRRESRPKDASPRGKGFVV
jgi:flagellar hook-length control protein FliK